MNIETFDFKTAVDYLIEGKKVWRDDWKQYGLCIGMEFLKNPDLSNYSDDIVWFHGDALEPYVLQKSDLSATDWTIYEEKKL